MNKWVPIQIFTTKLRNCIPAFNTSTKCPWLWKKWFSRNFSFYTYPIFFIFATPRYWWYLYFFYYPNKPIYLPVYSKSYSVNIPTKGSTTLPIFSSMKRSRYFSIPRSSRFFYFFRNNTNPYLFPSTALRFSRTPYSR